LKITSDASRAVALCIENAECIPGPIQEDGDPSQLRIGKCACKERQEENDFGECSTGALPLHHHSSLFLAIFLIIIF
jgi:hypothetical protein